MARPHRSALPTCKDAERVRLRRHQLRSTMKITPAHPASLTRARLKLAGALTVTRLPGSRSKPRPCQSCRERLRRDQSRRRLRLPSPRNDALRLDEPAIQVTTLLARRTGSRTTPPRSRREAALRSHPRTHPAAAHALPSSRRAGPFDTAHATRFCRIVPNDSLDFGWTTRVAAPRRKSHALAGRPYRSPSHCADGSCVSACPPESE